MNRTDERWQRYHKQIDGIDPKQFHKNPCMQRVIALSGGQDFLQHTKGLESELERVLAVFEEHPMLLPKARDRCGRKIHVSSEKYIYQVCLLLKEFPNLKGMRVLEVGGAFGGFARVLRMVEPDIHYTILDHVAMLRLASAFLGESSPVKLVSIEHISSLFSTSVHLFISHYCLSETPVEYQRDVGVRLFSMAQRAFIIDGDGAKPKFRERLLAHLKDRFGEVTVEPYPAQKNIEVFVGRSDDA